MYLNYFVRHFFAYLYLSIFLLILKSSFSKKWKHPDFNTHWYKLLINMKKLHFEKCSKINVIKRSFLFELKKKKKPIFLILVDHLNENYELIISRLKFESKSRAVWGKINVDILIRLKAVFREFAVTLARCRVNEYFCSTHIVLWPLASDQIFLAISSLRLWFLFLLLRSWLEPRPRPKRRIPEKKKKKPNKFTRVERRYRRPKARYVLYRRHNVSKTCLKNSLWRKRSWFVFCDLVSRDLNELCDNEETISVCEELISGRRFI